MTNILKNFIYQSIFQVTKIIIPIITIPIVSNALGPDGIGLYNYTNSIVQYFVLFAGLGVSVYGNREIAIAWNRDKSSISKVFWEIFSFKALMTLLFLIIYIFMSIFFDNRIYFMAQSITILAVLFDISWFFMGIEDFKKTSLVNLFVQIIGFILIVLFVKDSTDTLIYTLIQTCSILFSQIFVWFFINSYITKASIKFVDCTKHFKGAIDFFIPQVAITLYTNLNKTILGFFLGTAAVGYFSNSLQINNVIVTVITTLDIVLLPHMTGLFASNNSKKIIKTMDLTIHLQLFFSIPLMFGLLTIFDKLVPWFFGSKFLYLNSIIPWFSSLIIIVPLGMSISRQYLMPVGKIKEYNRSVIIGSVINIIVNMILLPTIGFFGVVIATITAEFFVTFIRTISFVKETGFKFNLKKILLYIVSGTIMLFVTRIITSDFSSTIVTTVVQVLIGSGIYFLLTSLFKINPIIQMLEKD